VTSQPHYSVSVAAAVVRPDGRVLAVRRRDNGHWEPPGGILEAGETIHAGLVREVHEETGITVDIDALTGVYQNMARGVIALVFRCHAVTGTPHPTDESSAVAWLTPDELTEHMDEAYAVRLLDALNTSASCPAVRPHDGVQLLL
jgi:8-oxo-dGTP diphosphatase